MKWYRSVQVDFSANVNAPTQHSIWLMVTVFACQMLYANMLIKDAMGWFTTSLFNPLKSNKKTENSSQYWFCVDQKTTITLKWTSVCWYSKNEDILNVTVFFIYTRCERLSTIQQSKCVALHRPFDTNTNTKTPNIYRNTTTE